MDLKQLTIFEEIYRTKSVTITAQNLNLSQPTVSMSLGRLRRHFNDPLFVRTSNGLEPTVHATELIKLIRPAHELLQMASTHFIRFDPATSTRVFNICMTDLGLISILPRLLALLARVAPSITLHAHNISEISPRTLASGEIDLAVGYMPDVEAGFFQQRLFDDHFVCVVRHDHPRIQSALTLSDFQREQHLAIEGSTTAKWILDKALQEQQVSRSIGLSVPSFLVLPFLLRSSDLISTVPNQLAQLLAAEGKIKIFPAPIAIPSYAIKQYWHERYTNAPATQWLRAELAKLLAT